MGRFNLNYITEQGGQLLRVFLQKLLLYILFIEIMLNTYNFYLLENYIAVILFNVNIEYINLNRLFLSTF